MELILIMSVLLLIVLLILGVSVPFCFGAAVVFLVTVLGYDTQWMLPTAYGKSSSILLMTIPMFILAGEIMNGGKIGGALVGWLESFLCRIKGNLVIVSVVACGIFGAVCGSGTATLSCIGSIVTPRMKDKKYPAGLIGAVMCCAAPLGLLIPPSGIQILVAWSGQLSVLACFLSTAVPGIILMTLLSLVSWILVRKSDDVPEAEKVTMTQFISTMSKRTTYAVPALIMPIIILGGIYGGFMTPTESAAVAALYALPVSLFIYKGYSLGQLKKSLIETSITTGVVMIMVIFISILSRMFLMEGLPDILMNVLFSVSKDPKVVLLMINLIMVVIGMIMDDTCGTLLITPILLPIMNEIGVSPYHFAAILGVNLGMGNITPPCAPFIFMASRVCKVETVPMLKPIGILVLFAYIPTLILTTAFPQLALWLPSLILGDKFIP